MWEDQGQTLSTKTGGKSAFNTAAFSMSLVICLASPLYDRLTFYLVFLLLLWCQYMLIFFNIHIPHQFKLSQTLDLILSLHVQEMFLYSSQMTCPCYHLPCTCLLPLSSIKSLSQLHCLLHFLHISVYHSCALRSFNPFKTTLKFVARVYCIFEIMFPNHTLWIDQ